MVKKVNNEDIEKKPSKISKISTIIANMDLGEIISPTKLFREVNMNPNDTGRDLLDLYDSLKEIGFVTLRDKNRKVKGILRTDESLDVRRDIKEIKIQILKLEGFMDKISTILGEKKWLKK